MILRSLANRLQPVAIPVAWTFLSEFAVKDHSQTSHCCAAMFAQLTTDMNVHPTQHTEG